MKQGTVSISTETATTAMRSLSSNLRTLANGAAIERANAAVADLKHGIAVATKPSEEGVTKALSDELASLFTAGFLDDRMVADIVALIRRHSIAPAGGEPELRFFYAKEIDFDNGPVECVSAGQCRMAVAQLQARVAELEALLTEVLPAMGSTEGRRSIRKKINASLAKAVKP
ncbi:hypothetical protein ACIPL1_27735 [Pseudomonas sp. NPDC090202]|uniref:hypothetical protein n=1 Tax=unclassified Pseudomonas TaxID=196821 RepID=UPI003809EBC3